MRCVSAPWSLHEQIGGDDDCGENKWKGAVLESKGDDDDDDNYIDGDEEAKI